MIFKSVSEQEGKLRCLKNLSELYHVKLSEGPFELMLKALETYPAEVVEHAAAVYVREEDFFRVRSLIDIIHLCEFMEDWKARNNGREVVDSTAIADLLEGMDQDDN